MNFKLSGLKPLGASVIMLLVLASSALAQQTGRITGQVTNAETGQPLPGVQVFLPGTNVGALTQQNGRYLLTNVPVGTQQVRAQLIGYSQGQQNVQVGADAAVTLNFALRQTALAIEEVVVTGVSDPVAGVKLPFTVGRVSAEKLEVPATGSPLATLAGKVAGVQVVRGSGQPGSGVSVQLRTPTSIQRSSAPLIVVDGVVLGANAVDIESLDVESIEILKGAAAASLYGSRAGSGVIQIRTSRGRNLEQGQLRVTTRSEYGSNSLVRDVPLTNSHEFRLNAQGEYVNAAGAVVATRGARTETESRIQDNAFPGVVYNPIRQFFDPGHFFSNSIALAQNLQNTNYRVSFTNAREKGVILTNDGLTTNNFRVNLDQRATDKLSLGFSVYHMRSFRDDLSGSPFQDLLLMPRDVDLLSRDSTGSVIQQPDPTAALENPIWRQTSRENEFRRERTTAAATARLTPLSWLAFDADVAYDRSNRFGSQYVPKGTVFLSGTDPRGSLQNDQYATDAINASAGATANNRFGQLTTRTSARASVERSEDVFFRASGTDFITRGVKDLDQARTRTVSSSFEGVRATGYYLNTGLDYAGRYIVDGLVRRDGSSLFGPDERWHTYYRASAAWRMADEAWWPFAAINEFKPRFSIGTAGGRPNYADQYETYSVSGTTGAISLGNKGNRSLKPEKSTEREYGVDIVTFNRRASLQLNYAQVVTVDQIIQMPPKGATGFFSQWANGGTMEGKTYEATLEAQLLNRSNLGWTLGMVADRSTHEITRWDRPCFVSGVTYRCIGETLGIYYGRRHIRDLDELPEAARAMRDEFAINDEGYVVWVGAGRTFRDGLTRNDANQLLWNTNTRINNVQYGWGQPIVQTDADGAPALVRVGDAQPKLQLGLTNSVRFGDFTVYGLLSSQIGAQVYNSTKQRMYQHFRHGDVDQAGKDEGLKKPTTYYFSLYNGNNVTEHFVEDATFVKLRELSLKYNLSARRFGAMRHVGADRISVGVIGRNLLTFTNFTGYDPEVGSTTLAEDSFGYPNYRTITATVEIQF